MEVRPLSQARIKPAYPKRQEESGSNPVQSGFESLRGHCAKALWKDQPRDGGGARFETGLPERACGFDPHSFRRSAPSGAVTWAGSSAGRAPVSHTGGSGFETRPVHSLHEPERTCYHGVLVRAEESHCESAQKRSVKQWSAARL